MTEIEEFIEYIKNQDIEGDLITSILVEKIIKSMSPQEMLEITKGTTIDFKLVEHKKSEVISD